MIDFFNNSPNLLGYTRDEYRVCEIYWSNATKRCLKLQKEYELTYPERITFTYLHSADFDCYGNIIPNVHAKENRERAQKELRKLKAEHPFLKNLPIVDLNMMEYRPIATYEAHFQRKATNGLL